MVHPNNLLSMQTIAAAQELRDANVLKLCNLYDPSLACFRYPLECIFNFLFNGLRRIRNIPDGLIFFGLMDWFFSSNWFGFKSVESRIAVVFFSFSEEVVLISGNATLKLKLKD